MPEPTTEPPFDSLVVGPADASLFRVEVGRYGERWYCDPLPGDDIAPATDWQAPAVSTIKKAAGNDWSYVAMKRIAAASTDELERLVGLDQAQRYDTLKSISQHGLSVAAGRGTIVHWWAEDMLHGRKPRTVDDWLLKANKVPAASLPEAERYLPALSAFFDTYQPELVAAEYVVCNRTLHGVGYGATPDGLFRVEGDLLAFDWKTRGEDSAHAAYPEEAAQIAAGLGAEYMIVEGGNGAERRPVPTAGGVVVSIKPDGCRVYPIVVDKALEHWEAMHAFWCARQTERTAILKPWHVKTAKAQQHAKGHILPRPAEHAPIDEGDLLDPALVAELGALINNLTDDERARLNVIAKQAYDGPGTISMKALPSRRRYEVARGLYGWTRAGWDDDVLRDLLAAVTGNDACRQPGIPLGAVVGALTIDQASAWAEMAQTVLDGASLTHNGDSWTLTAA